VDSLHQFFHDRFGQVPERHRGEVGKAEVEDPGRQAEQPALEAHIAEADQREQDAAGAGAREAGRLGHLGQRLRGAFGIEGADDREPARERLHVGIAGLLGGQIGDGHAKGQEWKRFLQGYWLSLRFATRTAGRDAYALTGAGGCRRLVLGSNVSSYSEHNTGEKADQHGPVDPHSTGDSRAAIRGLADRAAGRATLHRRPPRAPWPEDVT